RYAVRRARRRRGARVNSFAQVVTRELRNPCCRFVYGDVYGDRGARIGNKLRHLITRPSRGAGGGAHGTLRFVLTFIVRASRSVNFSPFGLLNYYTRLHYERSVRRLRRRERSIRPPVKGLRGVPLDRADWTPAVVRPTPAEDRSRYTNIGVLVFKILLLIERSPAALGVRGRRAADDRC
ncbi:hypothetical protein EVAR_32152_1, partial [Eumeta japonica]